MKRRQFLAASLAAALPLPALGQAAGRVTLHNDLWQIEVRPETLGLTVTVAGQAAMTVSQGVAAHAVNDLKTSPQQANWTWDNGDKITCALNGRDLSVSVTASGAGDLVVIDQPAAAFGQGMIFPLAEGHYVPKGDVTWQTFLTEHENNIDTTESLSLPLWGQDHGAFALTWLLLNPFNNNLSFAVDGDALGVKFSHSFTSLAPSTPMDLILHLGEDMTAGARRYRQYLIDTGVYAPLADKIAATPEGAKLIGATHVYLWGNGLVGEADVVNWAMFMETLRGTSDVAVQMRAAFEDDERDLIKIAKPQPWQQRTLIEAVNNALCAIARKAWQGDDAATVPLIAAYPAVRRQFVAAFRPALTPDIGSWGRGLSSRTVGVLKTAGLARLFIELGDGWEGGLFRPEGVAAFVTAGYLIGPYDSYETANMPGQRPDWATAQLGRSIYETAGIVRKDGTVIKGFGQSGHYINTLSVTPTLKSRLPAIVKAAGFNSLYLDVYASGMVFDDYRPDHTMTMAQNAAADTAAISWITQTLAIPVSSEDGNAVTSGAIMTAQGMQSPVMGWGDPDLQKDKMSPYYLGGYFPGGQPAIFFKQVPCKPFYRSLYFAPQTRLPLYQSVFHGSVITTNHWSYDNLKFSDAKTERALAQWLYNTAPCFHLSTETLSERLPEMHKQDAVFRPLHETLALKTMDGFGYLSEDRLVQQTTFSDGSRLIANFDGHPRNVAGLNLPAASLTALFNGQSPKVYQV